GSAAHVTSLRRLSVGQFHADHAISLDFLEKLTHIAAAFDHLQPVVSSLDDIPALPVNDTTPNAMAPDAVRDDHADMTDDVMADVTKAAAFETAEAAFERGRAAGIDEGRQAATAEITAAAKADAAAKLAAAIKVFEDMATGLRSVSAVERGALDATIRAAILRLAADRAGLAIDSAPDAFFARIDKMVGAIEATMATAKIKINPDDLAAISPHLAQQAIDKSAFIADPGLARGDVMVSVNGIEMRDIAADRIDTGEALVETTSLPDAGPETDGTMADLTSDAGDASDSGEVDNRDAADHAEHADHPGQNTDDEPAT
ncbi:MAG: FliH/SctL family protein, partial [Candidatus Puniceispirillum sp.]